MPGPVRLQARHKISRLTWPGSWLWPGGRDRSGGADQAVTERYMLDNVSRLLPKSRFFITEAKAAIHNAEKDALTAADSVKTIWYIPKNESELPRLKWQHYNTDGKAIRTDSVPNRKAGCAMLQKRKWLVLPPYGLSGYDQKGRREKCRKKF